MKKISIIILIALLIVAAYYFNKNEAEAPVINETSSTVDEPLTYDIQGVLEDVTNGAEVRGIVTNNTSGIAKARYTDGEYMLYAEFTNLPDPVGDDFYEGWVVRQGENFRFESTGVLTKETGGQYTNTFGSNTDLLDHDFYVLTLEPNDGDPAPADHIVEGKMTR